MHRTIPSSTFTAARGLSRAGLAVLGAMTCFASVQTANADVSVSHALVVTTRGELGIRLGENLYPIGMSTDQFILKYGRPSRTLQR